MLLEDDGSISSKFTITLKTASILDERRVVIGRIVKGLEVLTALENFGSRFGLTHETVVIKCGGILL